MVKNLYLWLLIAAVLLLAVQFLAVVIYVYSFIPFSAFWSDPFFKGVEPSRDALFYVVFVVTSIVLMALGVKWVLLRLDNSDTRRKFKLWLGLESVWCFLMVFCFFKWTTYRYPFWNILPYENSTWLQPFFCVVCALAALSKIFFPEIERFYSHQKSFLSIKAYPPWYSMALQVGFIVGVGVLLYIPRPQDVVGLALVWDQWNHLDALAGWFIRHGWFLGYEAIIQILVILAMVYIVGLFYFIRVWLKSWSLGLIGALLTIKMGMFYYGASPCIWINPANTFLSHGWDIVLFFGLWFVSWKYPKNFNAVVLLIGAVLVVGWFKSNGYMEALGLDNQPLMAPLRVRQFFPYFMGYFVPVFYVFNLLVLMGKKDTQNALSFRMPIIFCIYGLMIFVDYLEHPAIGYYGSLMVPAILIMLWWLKQLLSSSTLLARRGIYVGGILLVTGALLTNRLMLIYPNSIFQNKDRFTSERMTFEHFDAIEKSAALIRQLTQEDQRVVLLSNFETTILMQAHRQPLFRDFPVMFSSSNNDPGGLKLQTKKQCLELIDSITDENALYVFVDQRLLALSPQVLGNSGLGSVLGYLRNHYQIYAHQGFLVALQRR